MIEVTCGNCGALAGQTSPHENFYGRCPVCSARVEYVANLSQNRFSAYTPGGEDDPARVEGNYPPDGTRIMCPSCGRNLLGIWRGGALHIRHKGREWLASGVIGVHCDGACGAIIQIDTQAYNVKIVQSLQAILDEIEPIDATDAAIKLALENHIDLARVSGSGVGGRITKSDVETILGQT